jgi:hypothetical protein
MIVRDKNRAQKREPGHTTDFVVIKPQPLHDHWAPCHASHTRHVIGDLRPENALGYVK